MRLLGTSMRERVCKARRCVYIRFGLLSNRVQYQFWELCAFLSIACARFDLIRPPPSLPSRAPPRIK